MIVLSKYPFGEINGWKNVNGIISKKMGKVKKELFKEPQRIKSLLEGYDGRWAIAGGWALDLYIKEETRQHKDIEIAIPRNEQKQLRKFLKDWNFSYIKNGELIDWENNIVLKLPIHEVHARNGRNRIEILLNEIDDREWTYRRNPKLKYPINKLFIKHLFRINILAPEIVLLYKVKVNKAKDLIDLKNSIHLLGEEEKTWLIDAIKAEKKNSGDWLDLIINYTANT